MNARDQILADVRRALHGAGSNPVEVPRGYRAARRREVDRVDLFVERVTDYRAVVVRCAPDQVEDCIAAAVPEQASVVVADGLAWNVRGARRDDGLSTRALDSVDVVVTGATIAIAETGTIVLTHRSGEGRRALTLVPDLHVCVVRADQIVRDVPHAVMALDPLGPTTWISGPSATSDIELQRVEGVHGPRTLHVIVVG